MALTIPAWLSSPEHRWEAPGTGWGEPLHFYPTCSCGWEGIQIAERWFSVDETEFAHLPEPFATVARTYGPDSLLNEKSAYGTRKDAETQILSHLGYDPTIDRAEAVILIGVVVENLALVQSALERADTADETAVARTKAHKALSEVNDTFARLTTWGDGSQPTLPERNLDALRILTEHAEAMRTEADKPLTEKEKTFLRDAGVDLTTDA